MDLFVDGLLTGLQSMTWMEGIAFLFGVISVWYEKQENILVFPTGMVNVLLSVYICYIARLYADMGINGYYFIISIYGWYNWSREEEGHKILRITRNSIIQNVQSLVLTTGVFVVLYLALSRLTNSDVPFWDGLTTAFFVTAMWLVARKKIENWYYWIAGNLISIPLYFSKGLILFSLQYGIFLALAIAGLVAWNRKLTSSE